MFRITPTSYLIISSLFFSHSDSFFQVSDSLRTTNVAQRSSCHSIDVWKKGRNFIRNFKLQIYHWNVNITITINALFGTHCSRPFYVSLKKWLRNIFIFPETSSRNFHKPFGLSARDPYWESPRFRNLNCRDRWHYLTFFRVLVSSTIFTFVFLYPGISSTIAGSLAGGSFISKVLLANADALCAAASPLIEEDIAM